MKHYFIFTSMRSILFCLSCLLLVFSCDKGNQKLCGKTGTIRDNLGQDGCTLVIIDQEGDVFSPTNIYDFGIPLFEGQNVNFSYQLNQNSNTCILGITVDLVCMEVI